MVLPGWVILRGHLLIPALQLPARVGSGKDVVVRACSWTQMCGKGEEAGPGGQ